MVGSMEIGTASAEETAVFREWAHAEGWNPGHSDALALRAADPRGFLVGRLDGRPVSLVSAVRYGTGHGFLGFYLTRPDQRGRGHGSRLWQAAVHRLAGRNVGLDGVVAQQENYRRSGFRRAWTHLRYEGAPPADAPAGVTLVDGRTVPFGRLADLDRRFFPAPRDAFLALWTSLPGHRALATVRDGRLDGFAVARPAEHGTRIGPLYADSPETALALLVGVTAGAPPGDPVVLDVPDVNPRAVRLAEDLGLRPTFACARMYTGPVPELDTDCLYATTTLELG
ncbi:GNAT family N-acetyltransferase [Streptomyces sp. DSM 42041]|uniref:GNAT family N-acetyltransferase n=1 Tax=Streptomyces hazeniae TaxID=3075538 RepID=A0ABU2NUS1_9ACTN|nr:GNAT family N-acetyltransferase [Streptomyces sp. DSM 42041]MDT0380470.1 GNAT family N-acetyltransferase [Streptomyces sp. DSM 42041]